MSTVNLIYQKLEDFCFFVPSPKELDDPCIALADTDHPSKRPESKKKSLLALPHFELLSY
jgi:hypothetical protein